MEKRNAQPQEAGIDLHDSLQVLRLSCLLSFSSGIHNLTLFASQINQELNLLPHFVFHPQKPLLPSYLYLLRRRMRWPSVGLWQRKPKWAASSKALIERKSFISLTYSMKASGTFIHQDNSEQSKRASCEKISVSLICMRLRHCRTGNGFRLW